MNKPEDKSKIMAVNIIKLIDFTIFAQYLENINVSPT